MAIRLRYHQPTHVSIIFGCYLPWLVIKQDKSLWLLLPAALSLALFAWLLTLHPSAAGRTYAAYITQCSTNRRASS